MPSFPTQEIKQVISKWEGQWFDPRLLWLKCPEGDRILNPKFPHQSDCGQDSWKALKIYYQEEWHQKASAVKMWMLRYLKVLLLYVVLNGAGFGINTFIQFYLFISQNRLSFNDTFLVLVTTLYLYLQGTFTLVIPLGAESDPYCLPVY